MDPNRRRGTALVSALLVVVSLLGLSLALLDRTSAVKDGVTSAVDDLRARALAEAALAEAVHALRSGATGAVASADLPARLGAGAFWVEAHTLDNHDVRLSAYGLAGAGRAALELVVRPQSGGDLFRATLNSRETLSVEAVALIDSFDSAAGAYEDQVSHSGEGCEYANTDGDVLSAQDILLADHAAVFGDATPGPQSSVSLQETSYVHGSTAPGAAAFDFPVIETPSFGSQGPKVVQGPDTLGPGNFEYDSLTIAPDAVLEVRGPATIVAKTFTGDLGARLVIDATGGPVTVYCEGYSQARGFEVVAQEGSPLTVAFLVTGEEDVVFPAESRVRGAYYLERANLEFLSRCEGWGAFVANGITMSPGMRFHYDEALAQYWEGGGGPGSPVQLVARYEAAAGRALSADRRDPFELLGVDPAKCPAPAEAWQW